MISFTIPMHLKSCANLREHWAVRAKRVREARDAARSMTQALTTGKPWVPTWLPCTVTITRVAVRELDDDNMAAAAKGIRDGIADGMGLAGDRHEGLKWVYKQEKGKPSAVRIEIEAGS